MGVNIIIYALSQKNEYNFIFFKKYRKKISNITFYKEIIFILFYICISLLQF